MKISHLAFQAKRNYFHNCAARLPFLNEHAAPSISAGGLKVVAKKRGSRLSIDAILWDYDGTLVNSASKNIAVTKEVLRAVAPRFTEQNLPACLQSEAGYHIANHRARNWRELYRDFYGLTAEETDVAGALWSKYQARNETPVHLYRGIAETVARLASVPHAVCSQNSADNIGRVLARAAVSAYFKAVVGYDDVPFDCQKPAPAAGLQCLSQIFGPMVRKTIVYIGDHDADVMFARNLARSVDPSNRVLALAVTWSGSKVEEWQSQPDGVISSPRELLDYVSDPRRHVADEQHHE